MVVALPILLLVSNIVITNTFFQYF